MAVIRSASRATARNSASVHRQQYRPHRSPSTVPTPSTSGGLPIVVTLQTPGRHPHRRGEQHRTRTSTLAEPSPHRSALAAIVSPLPPPSQGMRVNSRACESRRSRRGLRFRWVFSRNETKSHALIRSILDSPDNGDPMSDLFRQNLQPSAEVAASLPSQAVGLGAPEHAGGLNVRQLQR